MMEYDWVAEDGTGFPSLRWGDPDTARAVMVCVHGLGGAHGNFEPLGRRLAEEGVFVAALTVRGQGLDPDRRRRGSYLDADVISADIAAFVAAHHLPGRPLFLCGESLGALLCARMLARGVALPELTGAIYSAPVVALARETPSLVRHALRLLATLLPGGSLSPSWFVAGKKIPLATSRDEEWMRSQREGPQHVKAFTFGALDAIGRLMAEMPEAARKINSPALVLAGGKDVFVREEQVRGWFEDLAAPDKTYLAYPDGHHVLWNDWDRAQVLDDITHWIRLRLAT